MRNDFIKKVNEVLDGNTEILKLASASSLGISLVPKLYFHNPVFFLNDYPLDSLISLPLKRDRCKMSG
jgi:hypothetical protein